MTIDEIRRSAGYQREVERLRATLADPGLDRRALHAEWIEFGKHGPLRQLWLTILGRTPGRTYGP